jgi:hypothetical protein
MPQPHPNPDSSASRVQRTLLLVTVLLTGCASAPLTVLPDWPIFSTLSRPVQPVPPATLPSTTSTPEKSAPANNPAPVAAQAAGAVTAAPAPPYGPAVAARFPDPSVIYSTPGLQAGRTTFTSQSEISSWLRDQASAATRNAGVAASVLAFGTSQRGEPLEALVLARASAGNAAALQANGRPTVLLIGQQHGDEPAGSEALLVLARELSQGLLLRLLERINVVIVPRANPDGAASLRRTTSNGLDMNRDHLLLNTPEARALALLKRDYHPTVVVDAHEYTVVGRYLEKFGTVQKFDALFQYATTANLPEFLTKAAEEWYRRPLLAALKTQGLSAEWYYTTSEDLQDKKISMGGIQPDTGRNVDGLKNTISLLIETRGIGIGRMHIQRRVHTHVTAITSVLAATSQRTAELTQLRPYIDKEIAALACKDSAIVEALPTAAQYELLMLDPASGADKSVTVDWDSALALRTVKARARPCGYWLSAASGKAVERLRLHGVQVQRVLEAGAMLADSYRETSRTTAQRQDVRGVILDADRIIKVEVLLTRGVVDVPRGSYYVPLNQPFGNLAFAALEPDTQSSYFANQLLDDLQSVVRVMAPHAVKVEELP